MSGANYPNNNNNEPNYTPSPMNPDSYYWTGTGAQPEYESSEDQGASDFSIWRFDTPPHSSGNQENIPLPMPTGEGIKSKYSAR